MRKLREIIRLHFALGLSNRAIAASCRMSPSTVFDHLARARAAGLGWPLPEELDDQALEALLFPHEHPQKRHCPEPDYALLHLELKKKHVTKQLLWEEYRAQHPDGYQYSQFCERYREWAAGLDVTMRQSHQAGEKLFVDFSGDGIDITDPSTGEVKLAKLFVATLGASNLTYVEPVLSEALPIWVQCHINALEFFGGVPEIVVPDNLKSGVTRADFYDPDLNPTYAELSDFYGFAVIPARKRKPRDKAKVEQAVLFAERRIIAALRKRQFSSLAEVREAIRPLLVELNNRPMQKLGRSRQALFDELERGALKPLPAGRYEPATWKKATVNIDYHVEFDHHYYSVHHSMVARPEWRIVDIRATATTVEVLWKNKRIASHPRSYEKHRHTTNPEHMPAAHRLHAEWPPSRIVGWAKSVGPCTAQVVEEIMARRKHPEQGYRSCLGVMRLAETYSAERLEAACEKAVRYRAFSRKSVESILKNHRDQVLDDDGAQRRLPLHGNIRGGAYYQ